MPEVCREHRTLADGVVRLTTLVEESVIPQQVEILHVLRGTNGSGGVLGRVTAIEVGNQQAVALAKSAAEATARLEQRWQRIVAAAIGLVIGGGAAGVGVWKALAALIGG